MHAGKLHMTTGAFRRYFLRTNGNGDENGRATLSRKAAPKGLFLPTSENKKMNVTKTNKLNDITDSVHYHVTGSKLFT